MSSPGWIKLHRGLQDHWIWDCEFSYAQAWIDLLLCAGHKPTKLMIKGQVIELKRGQQARSEVTLSKQWRWSRGKVRRFLNQCLNDGMIVVEAGHLTTIITICNYDSFQGCDTADGTSDGTPSGTTNGHLTVHKQEVKNLRTKEVTNGEPLRDSTAPATGTDDEKSSSKGSRIQGSWDMPADWIEWAISEKMVLRNCAESEAEKFKDYWISQPGAKGVKSNWEATWRNWIRSAIDRNPNIASKPAKKRYEFGKQPL